MSSRHLTIVVVEGPTDRIFLVEPMQQIFEAAGQKVLFAAIGKDVTSDWNLTLGSFVQKIVKSVRDTIDDLGIHLKDVSKIIQITDLDGAFIPDEHVFGGWDGRGYFYGDDGIHASDGQAALDRNARKRERTDHLLHLEKMCGVPYRLYYMCHNIEHVIVDERNCHPKDKKALAKEKRAIWAQDLSSFVDIIKAYNHGGRGWTESWDYIRAGMHSLERGTNLGLCFPKNWDKAYTQIRTEDCR